MQVLNKNAHFSAISSIKFNIKIMGYIEVYSKTALNICINLDVITGTDRFG